MSVRVFPGKSSGVILSVTVNLTAAQFWEHCWTHACAAYEQPSTDYLLPQSIITGCCMCVIVLLGVLQQCGSVLGSRVVLGMAQPALSVVLHPVCPVAVTQQEEVGLLSSQQQTGFCNTWETFPWVSVMITRMSSAVCCSCSLEETFCGLL